ncbi:Gonadotropin-releasing hormone II receptor [Dissostichus eleginoides]|uniref:Gonadotropin-releasing hormone II receptor n=1 Tax=Dissostichus eleginoides TaxID=100907 RepID=A0AAD9C3Q1_DISEL|nr:Gonadotropin-releasing hormone II receptor [Dissostichus eleginoides]
MSGNWSSLTPPPGSEVPLPGPEAPPLASEAPPHLFPSFTLAAQLRVIATALLFLFAAVSNVALLLSVWRGGRGFIGRGRGLMAGGRGQGRLASHLRPLMLSLAGADLMMTFVVMPLDAVWNVTVQWYGGEALCKTLSFLKLFAMHASAFVLVAISLDRQHAILQPLDLSAHRRNRRMLLLAWSLSLLLAAPQVVQQCVGGCRVRARASSYANTAQDGA